VWGKGTLAWQNGNPRSTLNPLTSRPSPTKPLILLTVGHGVHCPIFSSYLSRWPTHHFELWCLFFSSIVSCSIIPPLTPSMVLNSLPTFRVQIVARGPNKTSSLLPVTFSSYPTGRGTHKTNSHTLFSSSLLHTLYYFYATS
jgi:hypothetical protein